MMMIEVKESGAIVFDGMTVGEMEADTNRLVLNLGWCRLAGLAVTVEGDSRRDRKRIMLARPDDDRRLGGEPDAPDVTETREQSVSGST